MRIVLLRVRLFILMQQPEAARTALEHARSSLGGLGGHPEIKELSLQLKEQSKSFFADATGYNLAGNFQAAADALTRSLALDPDSIQSYQRRGDMHQRLRNWARAVDDYSSALALLAQRADAVQGPVPTDCFSLQSSQAVEQQELVRQLAVTYNQLATSHYQAASLEEAARCAQLAIEMAPGESLSWMTRGDIHRAKKDYSAAMYDYEQAYTLAQGEADPESELGRTVQARLALVHHVFGVRHFNKGQLAEALAEFTKATQLSPRTGRYHSLLGKTLVQLSRLPEALRSFSTALASDPRDSALGAVFRCPARSFSIAPIFSTKDPTRP